MDVYEELSNLYKDIPEDDTTGMRDRVENITNAIRDIDKGLSDVVSERDAAISRAQEAEKRYRERFFQKDTEVKDRMPEEKRTPYEEFEKKQAEEANKYKDITFNDLIVNKEM